MRPLTHQVWKDHFTQLRPYVLQTWPQIDRQKLEVAGDDYSAVVALIHKETGLPPDEAEHQLKTLDVPEMGLGTGE